ncbi:MAG TPA: glutamyl-tRNA reductase [Kribbellaceae bacterium]|jgi:glutamyl-tRNA reductase
MSYLVVGISHRSSDLALLERVALDAEAATKLALTVQRAPSVSESAVLATCNRTEVYADVERFHAGMDDVTAVLSEVTGVPLIDLAAHLYVHFEEGAVAHLFQVAVGLDSMVVGESQILGQVKETLRVGQDLETVGPALNTLLQYALRVGKRARAETGIDAAGRSVVSAGLDAVAGPLGGLAGRSTLVVGAGSMAALAATTLQAAGAGRIVVANRNLARASTLAERVGGAAIPLEQVPRALVEADLVVSCTGARGVVLTEDMIRAATAGGRTLGVLDVALPHDVDKAVADLDGVTLVALADLVGAAGGADDDIEDVRRIVHEETAAFEASRRAASVTPTVVALRAMASSLVEAELARLDRRLPDLDDTQREEVAHTIRRVVDKVLHTPTVRVKELAADPGGPTYADALRELFALDQSAVDAVTTPVAKDSETRGRA